jgi:GTP-binding protein
LGTGLGHDFLRHIERTRLLLHLVDITGEDPIAAYHTIQQELRAYDRGLAARPQILALNKIDAVDESLVAELSAELQAIAQTPVFSISAATRLGLEPLMQAVWHQLDQLNADQSLQPTL